MLFNFVIVYHLVHFTHLNHVSNRIRFSGYNIHQFDIDNESIYVSLMIEMRFLEMHDEEYKFT